MIFNRLHSECVVCNNRSEVYNTDELLCNNKSCLADADLRAIEKENFISILPVPKEDIDIDALPPLYYKDNNIDLFAITSLDEFNKKRKYTKDNRNKLRKLLPYSKDYLSEIYNLKCGNPILVKSLKLETELSNVGPSYILDFSSFLWSNTLKDPRSWAIINVALENNIKDLALWTAGNAGYSLSKIVQTINKLISYDKRINVYNIYDNLFEEIEPEVTFNIKINNGIIEGILSQGEIMSPKKIFDIISQRHFGVSKDSFWVVTDGLEGVGNEIYKLIFLQVLKEVKPSHIFIPIGTGNLFLAAYRAVSFLIKKGIIPITTKLIGAVPYGNNIYNDIINNTKTRNPQRKNVSKRINFSEIPVMPKLVGEYSPLRQCIKHSLSEDFVEIHTIDYKSQKIAYDALSKDSFLKDANIKFEPSSLAGFSALLSIDKSMSLDKVLVINTGIGNMGRTEIEYLKNKNCSQHRV